MLNEDNINQNNLDMSIKYTIFVVGIVDNGKQWQTAVNNGKHPPPMGYPPM